MPWTAQSIIALRQQRGETQAVFARKLGVGRDTVSNWENEESDVSTLNAAKLDRLAAGYAQPSPASLPDVLRHVQEGTAHTLTRLQEIRGAASAVHRMLLSLADQQGDIVSQLDPWSGLELSAERQLRKRAASTLRAAQASDPAASETTQVRPVRQRRAKG